MAWQHALHRVVVFGKTLHVTPEYMKELGATYVAYSLSFILMPVIAEGFIFGVHLVFLEHQSWTKLAAFWVALVLTGVLNFFTVSAVFRNSK